ncbi:MAG: murein DD-endopeptidase, partial [Myxococcota bacterium]
NPEHYAAHRAYLPSQEAAEVDALLDAVPPMATALSLLWPVSDEARISSPFGYRDHPTLKKRKFHNGVDIAVPIGTPVHAAGSGKVSGAKENNVSGRYVVLNHGHGVTTSYCHGDVLHVSRGDPVDAGTLIMDSGNTGRSTGPHLHFILKINGTAIDPLPFRRSSPVGYAD